MASTTPKVIVLSDQEHVQDERIAANVALTPGDLVEINSSDQLALHSTDNGNVNPLFVKENPYAEPGTLAAIDTDYGTADTVRFIRARGGDKVYGWLTVGGSVNTGDYLESAGSLGAVTAYVAGTALAPARVQLQAAESVNNAAGTAAVRLRIEVI